MCKTQIRHRGRVPRLYIRNVRNDIMRDIEYRDRGGIRLLGKCVCVCVCVSN